MKEEFRVGTEFQDQFTGSNARRFFNGVQKMFAGFYDKAGEELPPRVQAGARTRGVILVFDNEEEKGDRQS